MKRFLFLDTEFNGYGGQLISMGIVSDTLPRSLNNYPDIFYHVLQLEEGSVFDPWVQENVLPNLYKGKASSLQDNIAFGPKKFQDRLKTFLQRFSTDGFVIVADWPDDIKYFCEMLITSPGTMIDIPNFDIRIERVNYIYPSEVPHNALEDAIAFKRTIEKMHDFRLY